MTLDTFAALYRAVYGEALPAVWSDAQAVS